MVPVVQLVRASDCGSECRRFESVRAPLKVLIIFRLQYFFIFLNNRRKIDAKIASNLG